MTFLGNILLALAFLTVWGLFDLTFLRKMPGGDAGVGYAWALIYLNAAFVICTMLLAAVIGWKGGFSWVGTDGSSRFYWVSGAVLVTLISSVVGWLFKAESGAILPIWRYLGSFVTLFISLTVLVGMGILLNLQSVVSPVVYKAPLYAAASMSALVVAAGLVGLAIRKSQETAAMIIGRSEHENSNQTRILAEIDSCDVSKNMVFILVFTDANQYPAVRERALAKIKSRPDWQEEIIRRLDSGWADQAFTFLASNEVDDKALFAEPVRVGVLRQAEMIRKSIRETWHPSNFYESQFSWEVARVLRTVDKFEGMGVDYRPAVQELRAALDEPSEFKKPTFSCQRMLDKWLKKH